MIQSAQRKKLRLIIQTKRRYNKIVKHKVKTSKDLNDIDSSCTDDVSEDGKSDTSHNDQDSDMSFEGDNDEEIDAAEIEEEDRIEFIKRSTNEAMEKMENEKIRCWSVTQRRMNWRLAMRIALSPSEKWLIKAAEWNTELSSKYRTNRAIGKMTSTNSSNKLRTRLKIRPKAATKSIKIGSTQQKTAEGGLYSRKITQSQLREREEILITDQRGTSME